MCSFHGMDNDPVNIGSLITASVTSHRVSGRFCKFAARNIIVMGTTEVGDRILLYMAYVSLVVAFICLYKPFWYFVFVIM